MSEPATTLPAFTGPDSRCVKCGARAATTTYRSETRLNGHVLRIEHLERGCTRCSYRWPEATIDTVPPAVREGNEKTPADVRTSKKVTHSDQSTPSGDEGAR